MKWVTTIAVCICFLCIVAACKKDNDSLIRIEGFDWYDQTGVPMGHAGPDDNDWSFFGNKLSAQELALFDFMPADVNLDNTTDSAWVSSEVGVFPNPCSDRQTYVFSASDSVLLKMVVVNARLEVIGKLAVKFKGTKSLSLDYSDRSVFRDKAAIRLYFSFSSKNNANFGNGYGDIKICESANNCF